MIYQSENGDTKIDVPFVDETVWLSQQQMVELFQTSRKNVVEHIRHIYEEDELDEESTCRNFRQVRTEGSPQAAREIPTQRARSRLLFSKWCKISCTMQNMGILRQR